MPPADQPRSTNSPARPTSLARWPARGLDGRGGLGARLPGVERRGRLVASPLRPVDPGESPAADPRPVYLRLGRPRVDRPALGVPDPAGAGLPARRRRGDDPAGLRRVRGHAPDRDDGPDARLAGVGRRGRVGARPAGDEHAAAPTPRGLLARVPRRVHGRPAPLRSTPRARLGVARDPGPVGQLAWPVHPRAAHPGRLCRRRGLAHAPVVAGPPGSRRIRPEPRWWTHVGLASVAVAAACLVNPYGFRGVAVPPGALPEDRHSGRDLQGDHRRIQLPLQFLQDARAPIAIEEPVRARRVFLALDVADKLPGTRHLGDLDRGNAP